MVEMDNKLVSIEAIMKFMNEHDKCIIMPYKDLKRHINLTIKKGKCPCDTMNNRLSCPCTLAETDLLAEPYVCKCSLFCNNRYQYLNKQSIKDYISLLMVDINSDDDLIEIYRLILNIYYMRNKE